MQGEVSTKDIVFGAGVIAIFLVFAYFVGRLLGHIKNIRFVVAWRPLVPIVSGQITNDGGVGATSWLAGAYKGRSIRASMSPGSNRYSGDSAHRFNYFDVALLEVPGKLDWSLNERFIAEDKTLVQRLNDAGVPVILHGIGTAEAIYNATHRTLTIVQETGQAWVPSPAHFEKQINTLLRLAEVNQAVN